MGCESVFKIVINYTAGNCCQQKILFNALRVVIGLTISLFGVPSLRNCCNAKFLENNLVHEGLELENYSLIMFEQLIFHEKCRLQRLQKNPSNSNN